MTKNHYDLVGIGIGPFNLSLAALSSKVENLRTAFFDQKPHFNWHTELMFADADMQTSYLKDLVTPVDPTSPHSFLNYLVSQGLFYSFMNTNRKVVSRKEFEMYCQWVSENLGDKLKFNSSIKEVNFDGKNFVISSDKDTFTSTHLSLATGLTPRIPDFAKALIGPNVFHAKSPMLKDLDLTHKKVIVVGGGQTGIEIFRNILKGKWGQVKKVQLMSRRQNLEPLDESPFTNEYFTPGYVKEFFQLDQALKPAIVKAQKLSSDGNTPGYLEDLYRDLYQLKYIDKNELDFKILPHRTLTNIEKTTSGFQAVFDNTFLKEVETQEADVIILSTGFNVSAPKILEPIKHLLSYDSENRLVVNKNFDLDWKGPKTNKIYALNFSRHGHGVAEAQTSLMAWRSAEIINHLLGDTFYKNLNVEPSFIHYGKNI